MQHRPEYLTFDAVDDLGFAAERGCLKASNLAFTADELGPIFELGLLARSEVLPWPGAGSWLRMANIAPLMAALTARKHRWLCPMSRNLGLYRTYSSPPQDEISWVVFGRAMQWAAISAGFSRSLSAQIVGAIGELQDNIYQHSRASGTGVVAFRACPGSFESIVCDRGIGVLGSLTSCPEFCHVTNAGEALRLALSDGVSRFGRNSGRGKGYQELFTGLANLSGSLRFRSDDYALTIEGEGLASIPSHLRQKTKLNGYLISVKCRAACSTPRS